MSRAIIIFSFLVLQCFSLTAQNSAIDSLIIEADAHSNDELDIDRLSILQKAFNEVRDSASNYRLVEICKELGDLFFENKIYDSAIDYYKFVFTTDIDTIHKSKDLISIYRRIGQSYSQINKPDSALIYYKQIFKDFEYPDQIDLYRDIVEIYRFNDEHDQSLKYNLLIEELLRENNAPDQAFSKIYNNIAYNYHGLKNYNQAIVFFTLAINKNPNLSSEQSATILSNLGICHFNTGNNEQSIKSLKKAYELSKSEGQRAEIAHLIAEVFIADQDYLRSLKYYQIAEEHAKKAKLDNLLIDIYAGMSSVFNRTHEYDLAFEYFKNFSRLRDSIKLVDEVNRNRLIDNQKYIERAEKENTILKAQQDFQRLQIEQLETEARNQNLITEALRADSIQASNELALARQKNELAAITEANNELEIARQKSLVRLTNQQLEIAKSNEEKAIIESEKRQRETELAQQKLSLRERDAELQSEKEANEKKEAELEKGRVQQRNTFIISLLLALLAVFAGWAYRSKRKDNERLSEANEAINKAKTSLEEAEVKIRNLLKQQVSGAVAEALIMENSEVSDEQQFVAIMFLDIRDFTVFCEGKKPSEIIAYQNTVFGFMINIIEKHNGVVNQLVGDGFMATFGAPISTGNDCLNAYQASLKIIKKLEEKVSKNKIIPTKIGIGLHAGNVVTGNVGNEERKQFSITGNTVILAARLEQLNKQFGSTLVYSKELYEKLPENAKNDIEFKSVIVKGRSKAIEVAAI